MKWNVSGESGRGVIKDNNPAFVFRGYGKARKRQDTLRRPRFELVTSRHEHVRSIIVWATEHRNISKSSYKEEKSVILLNDIMFTLLEGE